MRKLKEVSYKNVDIIDELKGATFLGEGASKTGYKKDNKVIKIPVGHHDMDENTPNYLLDSIDEMEDLVEKITNYDERLVWSIGQFAMEIYTWEKLLELEKEGYDISRFAPILDYYQDMNGNFVIEQELTEDLDDYGVLSESEWEEFLEDIKEIKAQLKERWNINLNDIRSGNCGYLNGKLVCFDFGLSSGILYNYEAYEEYSNDDYYDSYDEDSCNEEDSYDLHWHSEDWADQEAETEAEDTNYTPWNDVNSWC